MLDKGILKMHNNHVVIMKIFLFSGNLQRSTIVKHNDSKEHKNSLEAHHMRKQLYNIDDEPTSTSEPKTSVAESKRSNYRNIRWLALESAVKTIHKCYGSIVMYLQSNEGKNTVGDCIAEGLLKEILHYKFPAFTAVLADILSVVGILCKQLQSDSLDFSQFIPMKESTIGQLQGLVDVNGKHTEEFKSQLSINGSKIYFKGVQLTHANEKTQVDRLKKDYIKSVCENIEDRMANETSPILSAFSVLEPQTNEMLDASEVDDMLKTLSKHYDIDEVALKREYSGISTLLKGSYRNISFKAFCKMIMRCHSEQYPLTEKLCHISLCIPVTSVPCERVLVYRTESKSNLELL